MTHSFAQKFWFPYFTPHSAPRTSRNCPWNISPLQAVFGKAQNVMPTSEYQRQTCLSWIRMLVW